MVSHYNGNSRNSTPSYWDEIEYVFLWCWRAILSRALSLSLYLALSHCIFILTNQTRPPSHNALCVVCLSSMLYMLLFVVIPSCSIYFLRSIFDMYILYNIEPIEYLAYSKHISFYFLVAWISILPLGQLLAVYIAHTIVWADQPPQTNRRKNTCTRIWHPPPFQLLQLTSHFCTQNRNILFYILSVNFAAACFSNHHHRRVSAKCAFGLGCLFSISREWQFWLQIHMSIFANLETNGTNIAQHQCSHT